MVPSPALTAQAIAPPSSGATMNNHSCGNAEGSKTAGPNDRAGLTEVPVRGIPTMWIVVRTSPMARPAKPGAASIRVTWSTTKTSRKVIRVSG